MSNFNTVAIFITFFTDGESQLNFNHVLTKMYTKTDQIMGNIPMLVQNFDEQPLVPLRIDNSGWGVNSSALFDVAGMRWYQRKYHVLYTIRQPIIDSIS